MPSTRHDYLFPASKAGHPHHWQHFYSLCCAQSCLPLGSSVHGIFQARILECLPCPLPGDLPNPGIELESPAFPALQHILYFWATGEAPIGSMGPFPMQNLSGSGWQRGEISSPSFRGSFSKRHIKAQLFLPGSSRKVPLPKVVQPLTQTMPMFFKPSVIFLTQELC